MILAAGRGERMRPLTDTLPKPLLEVKGKALIIYTIERLCKAGFNTIVINIAHLGQHIIDALGNGAQWGVEILYSDERASGALESAGGIIKALPLLGESFLVVNADVWCDYEFDSKFELGESLSHLILVPNPQHNPEGDFEYKGSRYTFSGIGYYKAEMFEIKKLQKLALAPMLRENIVLGKCSFELYKGVWRDIGTPQRLQELKYFIA